MATEKKVEVELHIETLLAEARRKSGYEGPFKVQIIQGGQVIQSTTSDALLNSPWTLDTAKLREAAKSGGEFWLVVLKPVVSCHWDFSYLNE